MNETDQQEHLRLAAFDQAMETAGDDDIGVDELVAAVVAATGGDPPSQAWLHAANEGSVRRQVTAFLAEASTWLGDAITQAEDREAKDGDRSDGQLRLLVFSTSAKNFRDSLARLAEHMRKRPFPDNSL